MHTIEVAYVGPRYICIDGGGSKYECRVLDGKGKCLPLRQHGKEVDCAVVEGANINFDGEERVERALRSLFEEVYVGGNQPLCAWNHAVRTVVGMAGVARPDPRAKVAAIFEKIGISQDRLDLQGDVEMALNAIPEENAVAVVCGTGHVIFGKVGGKLLDEKNNFFRLGGWGLEDDKASGYAIGMAGIKAVRARKFEKGEKTPLTKWFKAAFGSQKVLDVLANIAKKEITPKQVAHFQRAVFDAAFRGDTVSQRIVHGYFIDYVADQLDTFTTRHGIKGAPVHFMGGLMKSEYGDLVMQVAAKRDATSKFDNKANSNVAVDYVSTKYL